jgi:hypothetical protein
MKMKKQYLAALELKLQRVLETPRLGGSSKNNLGWKNLDKFGADWNLTASTAIQALAGQHHAKSIFMVNRIGQRVVSANQWEELEEAEFDYPPEVREQIDKNPLWRGDFGYLLPVKVRWAEKYREELVGTYCLGQAIRQGMITPAWSDHKDYKCNVILLPGDSVLRRKPSDYTQDKPFDPWISYVDEHGHELVKTDLGTHWIPDAWHFTGDGPDKQEPIEEGKSAMAQAFKEAEQNQSPIHWSGTGLKVNVDDWIDDLLDEKPARLWHPIQEQRWFKDKSFTVADQYALMDVGVARRIEYLDQVEPPEWVRAVNRHEAIPFRINDEMVRLLEDMDYKEADLVENPYRIVTHARQLAAYDQYYQRLFVDKRGRLYSSRSDIQYQGDDAMRCLVEFAEGRVVDKQGYDYLLFHAANLYEAPATTVKEKIAYGREHLEQFIAWAENAVATKHEWAINAEGTEVDDKYLFIRACMELRDATNRKTLKPKKGFVSHLPVEVDQTNSVIQHLALFYGDRRTSLISNLLQLGDLYSQIAEEWEIQGLTSHQRRKVIKKIIVPYCYGSGPETVALENLSQVPFLKEWTPDGKPRRKSATKQEAINASMVEGGYVEETAARKVKVLKARFNWSNADVVGYYQLVALAAEGIARVDQKVPIIKRFKKEVHELLERIDLPSLDAELAWPTMSGFELHLRPVTTIESRAIVLPKSRAEPRVPVKINSHYPSPYLDRGKLITSLQAHIVHSTDATLVHLLLADSAYPIIAVHDAFGVHACNVQHLREEFVRQLLYLQQAGRPFQTFRHHIAGDPSPEDGAEGYTLDGDPVNLNQWRSATDAIVNELLETEGVEIGEPHFLEMIG